MVGFSMQPYGIQSMLKEGHRHLSGLDEAVIKNIDACKQLSTITRTSLGPNGISFKSISCSFFSISTCLVNATSAWFAFRAKCWFFGFDLLSVDVTRFNSYSRQISMLGGVSAVLTQACCSSSGDALKLLITYVQRYLICLNSRSFPYLNLN